MKTVYDVIDLLSHKRWEQICLGQFKYNSYYYIDIQDDCRIFRVRVLTYDDDEIEELTVSEALNIIGKNEKDKMECYFIYE